MKKIAIILGEPNSINSEILAKSWKKLNPKKRKTLLIIGSNELLIKQFEILKFNIKTNLIKDVNENFSKRKINLMNVNLNFKDPFKVESKRSKKYILKCLDLACDLSKSSLISSFINCPIEKNIFKGNVGVTEFVSKKNSGKPNDGIMMIYNKKFSVVPLTNHTKITELKKFLKKDFINGKIQRLNKSYLSLFKKKPKIVFLGINPHLNELDKNSEERKILIPVIKKLRKNKININGPVSVDQIFLSKKFDFNILVGMYHDQVLGPFKTLFKFDAINITLGLKFLRVSPDHGTAKNLIKKNIGSSESLLKAINFLYKFND